MHSCFAAHFIINMARACSHFASPRLHSDGLDIIASMSQHLSFGHIHCRLSAIMLHDYRSP